MFFLKLIWGMVSGGGVAGIVKIVTDFLGKQSDNEATKFTAAVSGDRDVAVARLQTGAAVYKSRVDLLSGLKVTQWLIAGALVPPILHQGMIFLDSTPFPNPVFDWPLVQMHVVGTWSVPKAPEPYDQREWELIASLLGIQGAVSVGAGFVRALTRR
jgi:hypothetical protein